MSEKELVKQIGIRTGRIKRLERHFLNQPYRVNSRQAQDEFERLIEKRARLLLTLATTNPALAQRLKQQIGKGEPHVSA